ncbi:MAG: hypothetical protein QOG90_542 [Actinomycetota bacterium]
MTAHNDRCECTICGTVCQGRFAGCGSVWERGPREVAVNAPHPGAEGDRWRVPLEAAATSLQFEPDAEAEPAAAPAPAVVPAPERAPEPEREHTPVLESPDVTTRFAVAQLELLNDRVASLTGDTMARTEAALDRVATELERLRAQRDIDLTEQATGIFGAVQTGADALTEFTKTVTEVSDDLRSILGDALKAIGGTDGLAAWVAASAAEVTETREEFAASLGRIERDMTLLRRRANAEAKQAKAGLKLDDDQITYIVDAVTDSVLAALGQGNRKKR